MCVCVCGLHTGWVTEAQPISRRPQPKTEQRLSRFSDSLTLSDRFTGTSSHSRYRFLSCHCIHTLQLHISALVSLANTYHACYHVSNDFLCACLLDPNLHYCILRNETLISSCELWQLAQPDLLDSKHRVYDLQTGYKLICWAVLYVCHSFIH